MMSGWACWGWMGMGMDWACWRSCLVASSTESVLSPSRPGQKHLVEKRNRMLASLTTNVGGIKPRFTDIEPDGRFLRVQAEGVHLDDMTGYQSLYLRYSIVHAPCRADSWPHSSTGLVYTYELQPAQMNLFTPRSLPVLPSLPRESAPWGGGGSGGGRLANELVRVGGLLVLADPDLAAFLGRHVLDPDLLAVRLFEGADEARVPQLRRDSQVLAAPHQSYWHSPRAWAMKLLLWGG
ncbi:hypothetical protein VTK26DRAFT_4232 [Humicola hyalothermophila]